MSAEPDWVTPEGRLRWFSDHGEQTWLHVPHFDAAFVLLALDVARHERDVARADLADLRRQVAALADEMAEDIDASDHQWDKGWDAACRAHSIDLRDLIACPTCGGTAWVDWTDDHPGGICPDCKETP